MLCIPSKRESWIGENAFKVLTVWFIYENFETKKKYGKVDIPKKSSVFAKGGSLEYLLITLAI